MDYTPPEEEAFLSSLSAIPPIEPIVYEEEPLQPALVEKPKKVRGKKGKDGVAFVPATQSSMPAIQSTAPILNHSSTKATVEAFATPEGAPISANVGSPSVAPSMVSSSLLV